jgi:hypothetical protein
MFFTPDPDPGAQKHRIPDPDPQHWYIVPVRFILKIMNKR